MSKRLVVALGGNAILQHGQGGTREQQLANVRKTVSSLVQLVVDGNDLIITHGNGPQVGNLLIQNEWAREATPPMPLDVLGAQTQGMIGYMLQQSLGDALMERGISRSVVSLVTQVEVNPDDDAFDNPTKFVGPFVSEERAKQLTAEKGLNMKQDVDRGWRRVVPSPSPLRLVEASVISELVGAGVIVIASGGGGIPVVASRGSEAYHTGIEAVIDKDLAANLLAQAVDGQALVILTDIENVKIGYGTPDEVSLEEVDVETMSRYMEEGHFAAGSMGPKVEAAVSFVRDTGRRAMITSIDRLSEAIRGQAGTRVVPHETAAATSGKGDVAGRSNSSNAVGSKR